MSLVSIRCMAFSARMVTIKLKLIGMDRAVNPDLLEAITNTNDQAREMAERYEQAGPFNCVEHPDDMPVIEVSAIYQASVKVRKVKFCCQALADAVDTRMGQPTSPLVQKFRR